MSLFLYIAAACMLVIGCLRIYFGLSHLSQGEKRVQISNPWYRYRPVAQGLASILTAILLVLLRWLGSSLQGMTSNIIIGVVGIFFVCLIFYVLSNTTSA